MGCNTELIPNIYTGEYPSIKVGMCQVYTEAWAVESNIANAMASINEAADRGAELVITPECVIHGYGFEGYTTSLWEDTMRCAVPVDGEIVGQFRELAKKRGIHLVLGFAERVNSQKLHNSAALINPYGEIEYVYRKVHCRDFESINYGHLWSPGDEFYAADCRLASGSYRIGTMICFDREISESARCLRALGSQFIACPLACDTNLFTDHCQRIHNEVVTQVRAAENELFIAVVNHAGRFNGGSFLVGPFGEVLHQMGSEPGVAVLDIPLGAVKPLFHDNRVGWMGWNFRRPEVSRRYL